MQRQSIIYRLRRLLADLSGIRSDVAAADHWWEIDLILFILAGAFALGITALLQLW